MKTLRFWNKKQWIVFVLAASGGILLTVVCLFSRYRKPYLFSEEAKEGRYELPELAYQERKKPPEPSYFRIQINAKPFADKQSGRCNLMVGNSTDNEESVLVKLFLNETGEEIYCSEVLKPGERSAYGVLSLIPELGEYEVTAVFYILQPESAEISGEIEAELLLTVENQAV